MKPIVSLRELRGLCDGCPSDWEALDHLGREVYIRYRWGHLSVTLTTSNEIPAERLLSIKHGHPLDGVMDEATMVALTKDAIDWVDYPIHFPPS